MRRPRSAPVAYLVVGPVLAALLGVVVAADHPLVGVSGVVAAVVAGVAVVPARSRLPSVGGQHPLHGHRDPLTGLLDRRGLLHVLAPRLEAAGSARCAVLFVDLDGLKWINDSRGHAAGDRLLTVVASRMTAAARPSDAVARLGGDEFVVALSSIRDAGEAVAVATRMLASIAEPVQLAGSGELFPRASIGVAVSEPGVAAEDLLLDADTAMYRAKADGGSQVLLFNPAMRAATRRRHVIDQALHRAVRDDAITLVYQPLVEVVTGDILGFEALARWRDADLGVVGPGEFVPVAEASGLIHPLGAAVLDRALNEAVSWPARADGRGYDIAVNVSWLQLARGGFPALLADAVNRSGIDPARICVEVTETALTDAIDAVSAALLLVRPMGVRVAIDDFGTGHSSLRYLTQLPIDVVKIDRSFTAGVDRETAAHAVIAGVVAMARAKDLDVVAEGVERSGQLAALQALGVSLAQGTLIGPPVPSASLDAVIGPARRVLRAVRGPQVVHPVIPPQRADRSPARH